MSQTIRCDEAGALLAYRPLEVLTDDEALALEAHLADCAACRARLASLERAYAPLAEAVSAALPAGLWESVQPRLEAAVAEPAQPAQAASLTLVVHCAYCHDDLRRPEAVYCAACLAPHHHDCFRAHGRCSAPGCEETHVVRPHEVTAPSRPARRRWVPAVAAAVVLGLGVAALQGDPQVAVPSPLVLPESGPGLAEGDGHVHDEDAALGEEPAPIASSTGAGTPLVSPGRGGARPSSRAGRVRVIAATVLEVEAGRVLLDAGSDDGVRDSDAFVVWRDGAIVGRVQPQQIGADTAWASVLEGDDVRVGDAVTLADEVGLFATRPLDGLGAYYVEGPPRWTFRYLKSLLPAEGARLELHLTSADPDWTGDATGRFPAEILHQPLAQVGTREVVIVGDTAAIPSDLATWVAAGGGLVLVPGSGGLAPALRELSPVLDLPLDAVPPAAGVTQVAQHPAVATLSRALDGRVLPSLTGVRRGALQVESGRVLASYGDRPLLAVRDLGRGRVVYVGADDLWRWRSVTGLWRGLWLDVLRWARGGVVADDPAPSVERVFCVLDGRELDAGAATVYRDPATRAIFHTCSPAERLELLQRLTEEADAMAERAAAGEAGDSELRRGDRVLVDGREFLFERWVGAELEVRIVDPTGEIGRGTVRLTADQARAVVPVRDRPGSDDSAYRQWASRLAFLQAGDRVRVNGRVYVFRKLLLEGDDRLLVLGSVEGGVGAVLRLRQVERLEVE